MTKLVTSKYTGTHGIFAYLSLKSSSLKSLFGTLNKYGIKLDQNKTHLTVLSSRYSSLPVDFEIHDIEVNALVSHFEIITTEKGSRVMMHVVSKRLYRLHNFMKRTSSTDHKYGTFMPHITVVGYDDFKEEHRSSVMALNEMLVHSPMYVELTDLKLSNYGD